MFSNELVDLVAVEIYRFNVCHPKQYEEIVGEPMKEWKTDAPWDTNLNELTEWERDDFRRQAKAVLERLNEHGFISAEKLRG